MIFFSCPHHIIHPDLVLEIPFSEVEPTRLLPLCFPQVILPRQCSSTNKVSMVLSFPYFNCQILLLFPPTFSPFCPFRPPDFTSFSPVPFFFFLPGEVFSFYGAPHPHFTPSPSPYKSHRIFHNPLTPKEWVSLSVFWTDILWTPTPPPQTFCELPLTTRPLPRFRPPLGRSRALPAGKLLLHIHPNCS